MDEILKLLQDHFHQQENPDQLIQSLLIENDEKKEAIEKMIIQIQEITNESENIQRESISLEHQNQKLKIQNEKLTQTVQQQNKEIENLKETFKLTEVNLSETNGIISYLKQNDPNPVLVTSSSNGNPFEIPENALNVSDTIWSSKDIPNSWIQFNFKNMKIAPSKYLIRNKSSNWWEDSPQGWKLEGSNDGSNWESIHEVRDCESFRQANQEASFSCETSHFFSFLRFTQTEEDLFKFHGGWSSYHYFLLNFVEFAGKIISN
jgi:hypothetical protein